MRTQLFFALALLVTGCGLETEPSNPDPEAGSGATSGQGGESGAGSGGDDAGDGGGSGGTGGSSGGTGGQSGSGGQGGDSAVSDCDDHPDCSATLPQCSPSGHCISCTSDDACEDRGPLAHCEMTLGSDHRGHCVACLEDDDCNGSDDGEYCLDNACVPCKTNADCTDLTKPECGEDGQCTGCTSDEVCEGRGDTQTCVTDAGPKRGHCVACIENSDCTTADKPECKPNNVCGSCTDDAACTGREGHERCNRRTGAATFAQCVECTGATEADDCDGTSCKQSTGECTDTPTGMSNPCEPCEADSECGTGTKCVKHMFGDTDLGNFCFYQRTTCADGDSALKPFSQALTDTLSVDSTSDGEKATYCLPITSCQAIVDATGGVACGIDSTMCGIANIADGTCLEESSASGKCSFGCLSDADCLNGIGDQVLDSCKGPPAAKTCQP